jgi:hypothetical protein
VKKILLLVRNLYLLNIERRKTKREKREMAVRTVGRGRG